MVWCLGPGGGGAVFASSGSQVFFLFSPARSFPSPSLPSPSSPPLSLSKRDSHRCRRRSDGRAREKRWAVSDGLRLNPPPSHLLPSPNRPAPLPSFLSPCCSRPTLGVRLSLLLSLLPFSRCVLSVLLTDYGQSSHHPLKHRALPFGAFHGRHHHHHHARPVQQRGLGGLCLWS